MTERDVLFAADLVTELLVRAPGGKYALATGGERVIAERVAGIADPVRFEAALLEVVRFACFLEAEHGATEAARAILRGAERASSRLAALGREPVSIAAERERAEARCLRFAGDARLERFVARAAAPAGSFKASALAPRGVVRP